MTETGPVSVLESLRHPVVLAPLAGGHRGTGRDDDPDRANVGVLAPVRLVRDAVVAGGGIATAGAAAAVVGTALLRCPQVGTPKVHRAALAADAPTVLTRAAARAAVVAGLAP
jgi:NAD(P)H-dependent flavin oxidoreductase YrpB (nitropropane dioxygenase family)